ncbi:MAG TPA: 4Fe-4S dicluster domain-containing protein [Chloroflexota bacterium]|nr:4Fe-4S dicluster domain-containing protein [Chloroflexota bacterium]
MRYGFIIDQRKCIGCHACTVACKQENGVALGDFRTWVKYTEKGVFPHVQRSFLVERCNHCDDAPCVEICPVTALWRRPDGIVDFSGERCIGCRSCMAACPYDAIYIDPDSHTIGKCNYCAHRVDVGLQPACVNVCPVEAIITGDIDNPDSRIAQLLGSEPAMVRRPEKGTRPKLFYLGADAAAVNPEATSERAAYMWAEADQDKPIRIGDVPTEWSSGMVQRDYAVSHRQPWGWHVAAYLWTKSIAAGALLVAAFLFLLGGTPNSHSLLSVIAPLVALLFLGITNLLLVLDLERPERFWRVMLWPHWSSWLVIGAYILAAYGALLVLALGAQLLGLTLAYRVLLWPAGALALAAATYSAALLAQARGRDLWQSPLLASHLGVQAVLAGAAVLSVLAAVVDGGAVAHLAGVLAAALGASLVLALSEVGLPHGTAHARLAIRAMTRGSNGAAFWYGVIGAGTAGPIALAIWSAAGGPAVVAAVAAILALTGLALYEDLYIDAGQSVPLS